MTWDAVVWDQFNWDAGPSGATGVGGHYAKWYREKLQQTQTAPEEEVAELTATEFFIRKHKQDLEQILELLEEGN